MKLILQSESACIACKAPKQQKEFRMESDEKATYPVKYERYIINDCNKCGKYTAKLK